MKISHLLILSLLFSVVNAQGETIPIVAPAGQSTSTMIYLNEGDVISGSLTVRGGEGYVFFYVKDLSENEIVPMTKVQDSGAFSFISPNTTSYSFNFDNRFSDSEKNITMQYTVLQRQAAAQPEDTSTNTCEAFAFIPALLAAVLLLRG